MLLLGILHVHHANVQVAHASVEVVDESRASYIHVHVLTI